MYRDEALISRTQCLNTQETTASVYWKERVGSNCQTMVSIPGLPGILDGLFKTSHDLSCSVHFYAETFSKTRIQVRLPESGNTSHWSPQFHPSSCRLWGTAWGFVPCPESKVHPILVTLAAKSSEEHSIPGYKAEGLCQILAVLPETPMRVLKGSTRSSPFCLRCQWESWEQNGSQASCTCFHINSFPKWQPECSIHRVVRALDGAGLFKEKMDTFGLGELSWKLQAHLHNKYLLSACSAEVIET